MATNRYTQQVQASTFNPMSLQEMAYMPTIMRQREDDTKKQLMDLDTAASQIVDNDEQVNKTLKNYQEGLTAGLSQLSSEGYNDNTEAKLVQLKRQYNKEITPINKYVATKAASLQEQHNMKAQFGDKYRFSKDVNDVDYGTYLKQGAKAFEYSSVDFDKVSSQVSASAMAITKDMFSMDIDKIKKGEPGYGLLQITKKKGLRSEDINSFLKSEEGLALQEQIIRANPSLADIKDPGLLQAAMLSGVTSAVGVTDESLMKDPNFMTSAQRAAATKKGVVGIAAPRTAKFGAGVNYIGASIVAGKGFKEISSMVASDDEGIANQAAHQQAVMIDALKTRGYPSDNSAPDLQARNTYDVIMNPPMYEKGDIKSFIPGIRLLTDTDENGAVKGGSAINNRYHRELTGSEEEQLYKAMQAENMMSINKTGKVVSPKYAYKRVASLAKRAGLDIQVVGGFQGKVNQKRVDKLTKDINEWGDKYNKVTDYADKFGIANLDQHVVYVDPGSKKDFNSIMNSYNTSEMLRLSSNSKIGNFYAVTSKDGESEIIDDVTEAKTIVDIWKNNPNTNYDLVIDQSGTGSPMIRMTSGSSAESYSVAFNVTPTELRKMSIELAKKTNNPAMYLSIEDYRTKHEILKADKNQRTLYEMYKDKSLFADGSESLVNSIKIKANKKGLYEVVIPNMTIDGKLIKGKTVVAGTPMGGIADLRSDEDYGKLFNQQNSFFNDFRKYVLRNTSTKKQQQQKAMSGR